MHLPSRQFQALASVLLFCFVAWACSDDPVTTEGETASVVPLPLYQVSNDTVAVHAVADAFIQMNRARKNTGGQSRVRIKGKESTGRIHRGVIRFDSAQISGVVGQGQLVRATLQLTVMDVSGWGSSGRFLGLHSMTQGWTEMGVTWNCADDLDPSSSAEQCDNADVWDMVGSSPPYDLTPSDSALIMNGTQGTTVSFDVTQDIAGALSGTLSSVDWILAKADESKNGDVEFYSRTGMYPPVLRLEVESGGGAPVEMGTPWPDDSLFVIGSPTNSDVTYFRRLVRVEFVQGVETAEVEAFLTANGGEIVGLSPDGSASYVMLPDPGGSWAVFHQRILGLKNDSRVSALWPLQRETPLVFDGRYPSDGVGADRTSWFNSASGLDAYRDIRAPAAWACENGQYGRSTPRLGVLEAAYETAHADLNASKILAGSAAPGGNSAGMMRPVDQAIWESYIRHGNAVAGVLGAVGDNGAGVAGMLWGPSPNDWKLYQLSGLPMTTPTDPTTIFLDYILPIIQNHDLRVLSLSTWWPLTGDFDTPGAISSGDRLALRMEEFLTETGTIVFQSAGNDNTVYDPAASNLTSKGVWASVRSTGGFDDRFSFVASTNTGGSKAGFSSFWLGQTELAAPGDPATAVGVPSIPGIRDVRSFGGTSFSTPLVAGVAAQLLTMDPSLTPAEVMDYLRRGARVSRIDSTGVFKTPDPVAGFPESVYRLDAYGSLSLLSNERAGVPLCGVPVTAERSPPGIRIQRSGGASLFIPLPDPAGGVAGFSVAPGGAKIAITQTTSGGPGGEGGSPPAVFEVFTFDHLGNQLFPVRAGVVHGVTYLERDSATYEFVPAPLLGQVPDELWIVYRDGVPFGPFSTLATLASGGTIVSLNPPDHQVSVSPDALSIAVRASVQGLPCGTFVSRPRTAVVDALTGVVGQFLDGPCAAASESSGFDDLFWDQEGAGFTVVKERLLTSAPRTEFTFYNTNTLSVEPATSIPGVLIRDIAVQGDGRAMWTQEEDVVGFSGCHVWIRSATDPSSFPRVSTPIVCGQQIEPAATVALPKGGGHTVR